MPPKPKPPKVDYDNWDGQKIEEDKAMHRKLGNSPKSRWSFSHRHDNYDDIDWSKKGGGGR